MKKGSSVMQILFLVLLSPSSAVFAAAQHEGHDPGGTATTREDRFPRGKTSETNCETLATLAAELEEDFGALVETSDAAALRSALSRHKVKLQELRVATEICGHQCGEQPKRRGCGRMMRH